MGPRSGARQQIGRLRPRRARSWTTHVLTPAPLEALESIARVRTNCFPNLVQGRRNVARKWPTSTNLGAEVAHFGPRSTEIAPNSAECGPPLEADPFPVDSVPKGPGRVRSGPQHFYPSSLSFGRQTPIHCPPPCSGLRARLSGPFLRVVDRVEPPLTLGGPPS